MMLCAPTAGCILPQISPTCWPTGPRYSILSLADMVLGCRSHVLIPLPIMQTFAVLHTAATQVVSLNGCYMCWYRKYFVWVFSAPHMAATQFTYKQSASSHLQLLCLASCNCMMDVAFVLLTHVTEWNTHGGVYRTRGLARVLWAAEIGLWTSMWILTISMPGRRLSLLLHQLLKPRM